MLTRVLIVDDELLARNRLRYVIDWEKEGFLISAEAEDGMQAIQLIREVQPHIVLMDIDMPLMDGVSLCHFLNEHYRDIEKIVLSNYDHFDYVRDTLNSGAVDYLLKHRLAPEQLLQVLRKAESRQREASGFFRTEPDRGWNAPESRPGAAGDWIRRLIQEDGLQALEADAPEAWAQAQALGTPIAVLAMQVLPDIRSPEQPREDDRLMFGRSVLGVCRQLIGHSRAALVDYVEPDRIVFLLSYKEYRSESPILQSVRTFVDKVKKTLQLIFNITVQVGSGPVCFRLQTIPQSYRHACSELSGLLSASPDTPGERGGPAEKAPASLSIRQEKDLLSGMMNGNLTIIHAIVDDVAAPYSDRTHLDPRLVLIIEEMIHVAHRAGKKAGVDVQWMAADTANRRSRLGSWEEMKAWVVSVYSRLIDQIRQAQTAERYTEHVKKAIGLIHAHYRDGLTLEETADRIGITSSYLGKLFKEEAGMSFTEYVNHYKIELSKQCIESGNHKIKEMYRLFGFNSYSYFFKVFKEIVGETPQSYAKKRID